MTADAFLGFIIVCLFFVLMWMSRKISKDETSNVKIDMVHNEMQAGLASVNDKLQTIKTNDIAHLTEDVLELRQEVHQVRNAVLNHTGQVLSAISKLKDGK